MLRVLVADDSALAREALMEVINDDAEMMVAGVATSGRETVRKAADLRPDLVTMDLLMPDMDGVEATRQIMAQRPVPIVLVSSTVGAILGTTHFDALSVGAVDVMEKPDFTQLRSDVSFRRRFLDALKGMSQVVTVTRRERRGPSSSAPPQPRSAAELSLTRKPERLPHGARLIVGGASTGGPPALARPRRPSFSCSTWLLDSSEASPSGSTARSRPKFGSPRMENDSQREASTWRRMITMSR
jgi:two-component system chemotaxis response regulator CheB